MKFALKPIVAATALALCANSLLAYAETEDAPAEVESAATWYNAGQKALQEAKRLHPNMRRAKKM